MLIYEVVRSLGRTNLLKRCFGPDGERGGRVLVSGSVAKVIRYIEDTPRLRGVKMQWIDLRTVDSYGLRS